MWELHFLWNDLPDYNFGWLVLILAAYMIWERWERTDFGTSEPGSRLSAGLLFLPGLLFVTVSVLYKWVFARTPAFSLGISLGCALILMAMLLGSHGCLGLRTFIFPILFVFVAVPLPQIIWNPVVLSLQNLVSFVNVEALNLFGVPAVRHGSVIQLPNCLVGVDEACSGVRSLQSSIMAALFIGDVMFKSRRLRCMILAVGVLLALFGNMVRALILSLTAFRHGENALDAVHDGAGWGILAFTTAGLVLGAWLVGKIDRLLKASEGSRPINVRA